jgi:hypothetical protein
VKPGNPKLRRNANTNKYLTDRSMAYTSGYEVRPSLSQLRRRLHGSGLDRKWNFTGSCLYSYVVENASDLALDGTSGTSKGKPIKNMG